MLYHLYRDRNQDSKERQWDTNTLDSCDNMIGDTPERPTGTLITDTADREDCDSLVLPVSVGKERKASNNGIDAGIANVSEVSTRILWITERTNLNARFFATTSDGCNAMEFNKYAQTRIMSP